MIELNLLSPLSVALRGQRALLTAVPQHMEQCLAHDRHENNSLMNEMHLG